MDSQFTDHHLGNALNFAANVNYFQYYYATDFAIPSYLTDLSAIFSAPGVSSTDPALPLWIKDTLNKCILISSLAAEE